jgi:cytochrome c1
MNSELQGAINVLQRKVAEQEKALANTKNLINQLCAEAGEPPIYSGVQRDSESSGRSIRSDQYYGQPLATAVRSFLEGRESIGPATVDEIYDALIKGGFQFEGKSEDNQKRALRISLTKNSITFHKVPNGSYGLLSWYPNAKPSKAEAKSDESSEPVTASVSFFITNKQKAILRDKGYDDEQISQMAPAEAHRILGLWKSGEEKQG